MSKTGILGGTFDPVHNGHLAIAAAAARSSRLDRVIFVPANNQPLKHRQDVTPAELRLKMLELAIADNPLFEISLAEIDRPAPSFTIDTLKFLRNKLGSTEQLYFILGWDSLEDIASWKAPEEIIEICTLIAVTRSTVLRPDLEAMDKKLHGIEKKTILLDMPPVDISSTEIRKMVRRGLSIKGLVPDEKKNLSTKMGCTVCLPDNKRLTKNRF